MSEKPETKKQCFKVNITKTRISAITFSVFSISPHPVSIGALVADVGSVIVLPLWDSNWNEWMKWTGNMSSSGQLTENLEYADRHRGHRANAACMFYRVSCEYGRKCVRVFVCTRPNEMCLCDSKQWSWSENFMTQPSNVRQCSISVAESQSDCSSSSSSFLVWTSLQSAFKHTEHEPAVKVSTRTKAMPLQCFYSFLQLHLNTKSTETLKGQKYTHIFNLFLQSDPLLKSNRPLKLITGWVTVGSNKQHQVFVTFRSLCCS